MEGGSCFNGKGEGRKRKNEAGVAPVGEKWGEYFRNDIKLIMGVCIVKKEV
ncbi:hypothetical protein SESBI_28860 [Sesbania bispinosa]|nr:hypothetical protein SESBI_28860 [Sesbania bispinosa]